MKIWKGTGTFTPLRSWRRKSKNSSLQVPRSFQELSKVSTKHSNLSDALTYRENPITGKVKSENRIHMPQSAPFSAMSPGLFPTSLSQWLGSFVQWELFTLTTGHMTLFLPISVAHPCHANYIDSTKIFPLFYFGPCKINGNQRNFFLACLFIWATYFSLIISF